MTSASSHEVPVHDVDVMVPAPVVAATLGRSCSTVPGAPSSWST